ncbi:MAG: hypothetical protein ACERKV_13730 [Clostridiaceae bacterium]
MNNEIKKVLYRTIDGIPNEDWYYIIDPDELVEAADLDGFSIYKVCNLGNKICSNLNKLAEEVRNDFDEKYCDCDYDFDGDDVINEINERFDMELELEYCPDLMIFDEDDILWDEEEMKFYEPNSFNTEMVYHFWDFQFQTWTYEIPDEIIEISDCIAYTYLDEIENTNGTSFCTGGIGHHSYVAYLRKNQYLIKEESDWEYTRTIAKVVDKKELINYLENLKRNVNYYLKKIHY